MNSVYQRLEVLTAMSLVSEVGELEPPQPKKQKIAGSNCNKTECGDSSNNGHSCDKPMDKPMPEGEKTLELRKTHIA